MESPDNDNNLSNSLTADSMERSTQDRTAHQLGSRGQTINCNNGNAAATVVQQHLLNRRDPAFPPHYYNFMPSPLLPPFTFYPFPSFERNNVAWPYMSVQQERPLSLTLPPTDILKPLYRQREQQNGPAAASVTMAMPRSDIAPQQRARHGVSAGPVYELNQHDVLFGLRGLKHRTHSGNVLLHELMAARQSDYRLSLVDENVKMSTTVATEIVRSIRRKEPAARFLKYHPKDGAWYDIGDVNAIEKVGRALYDRIRDEKKSPRPRKQGATYQQSGTLEDESRRGSTQRTSLPVSAKRIPREPRQVPPLGIAPVNKPSRYDVFCGRDPGVRNHAGNALLRELVRARRCDYSAALQNSKRPIAASIVQFIRQQEPPGRFLSKDPVDGAWYDIGYDDAIGKVQQAFRDALRGPRNKCIVEDKTAASKPRQVRTALFIGPVNEPNHHDVLCGERDPMHTGNVLLRTLVMSHMPDLLARRNSEKTAAARIVQHIRHKLKPAGLFLKYHPQDGAWYDIGNVKAIQRVETEIRRLASNVLRAGNNSTVDISNIDDDELSLLVSDVPGSPFVATKGTFGESTKAAAENCPGMSEKLLKVSTHQKQRPAPQQEQQQQQQRPSRQEVLPFHPSRRQRTGQATFIFQPREPDDSAQTHEENQNDDNDSSDDEKNDFDCSSLEEYTIFKGTSNCEMLSGQRSNLVEFGYHTSSYQMIPQSNPEQQKQSTHPQTDHLKAFDNPTATKNAPRPPKAPESVAPASQTSRRRKRHCRSRHSSISHGTSYSCLETRGEEVLDSVSHHQQLRNSSDSIVHCHDDSILPGRMVDLGRQLMTPSTAIHEKTRFATSLSASQVVAPRPGKGRRLESSSSTANSALLSLSSSGGGDQWEEYYYQLAFFKAMHRHTNVPWDYVCEDDNKLNLPQWVLQQRCELLSACLKAETKNKTLPQQIQWRLDKLTKIGFERTVPSGHSQSVGNVEQLGDQDDA
jgi:Helicase associated domain